MRTMPENVEFCVFLVLEQSQVQHLIALTSLGCLGKPDDIASAITLLVSDDAH